MIGCSAVWSCGFKEELFNQVEDRAPLLVLKSNAPSGAPHALQWGIGGAASHAWVEQDAD